MRARRSAARTACHVRVGRARARRARRAAGGGSVSSDGTRHRSTPMLERHGLKPDEYDAHRRAARARAESHRARHLLRDVVGALQLQELARPSEDAADRGPAVLQGRARTPAPWTSATASRRCSRSSRTTIRRSSSRIRARRRASAASSATSSRWARGRSRCSNSLRFGPTRRAAHAAHRRRRRLRHRRLRQQHRHSDRRRRSDVRRAYAGNPLVNVFCLGIARHDAIVKGAASGVGNPVYYVGAKTGRDGIHGATMASAEFDEKSAEKRPAVQVGDPFMEKLLLEACLEVMETDACVGMQDMGAAGLTCATSETGSRGGVGHRDRRRARAAARNRHDAVRDHAVRVAGAHAAHRQARPRGGSRAHLREVGSARRAHRRSDRRRPAAHQAERRGRRRSAESRADRRGAGLPAADRARRPAATRCSDDSAWTS